MFVLIKKILKKVDRRIAVRSLASGLVFVMALSLAGFEGRCQTIRDNCLRLHILANSDSEADQALKLKVRDELLKVSETVFNGCADETEAVDKARESLELFKQNAEQVIRKNGYDYSVSVEVAETLFETRDYESFSLPAGNYEALRVIIGEGKGKNWWCVMFPAVCLPTATEGFSAVLDGEATKIVEQPTRYKARFKVVELYEKTRARLVDLF